MKGTLKNLVIFFEYANHILSFSMQAISVKKLSVGYSIINRYTPSEIQYKIPRKDNKKN